MKLAWLAFAACTHAPPPVQPTPSMVAPMAKLAVMRGVWIGEVSGVADGVSYKDQLAARIGPMLGGDIEVLESRSAGFATLEIASWNPRTQKYELRSYVKDVATTSELTPTADGFTYDVPAGTDAVDRATIAITGDRWHEVGDHVTTGKPPVRSYEVTLTRVGDTDWPLGTPVAPK